MQDLIAVASRLGNRGWTPATSSNFSCKLNTEKPAFAITQSGRDKAQLALDDLMVIDESGLALEPKTAKPSAETVLHLKLYNLFPCGAVLHTHSVLATATSMHEKANSKLEFEGFELLKAFTGIKTHDTCRFVPVIENSQDMNEIWRDVEAYLPDPLCLPAFLIRGHGAYAWGEDVFAAQRHLEALEHLLECRRVLRWP